MKTIYDFKIIDTLNGMLSDNGHDVDEINFFGIRNLNNLEDGIYNDTIGYWTQEKICMAKGTTDPSSYYIKENPMNPEGTAIMVTGYHDDIWVVGMHPLGTTSYQALVNTAYGKKCKPQKVNRLTKDFQLVMEISKIPKVFEGFFGCNLHHGKGWEIDNHIGGWSAGCQVYQDIEDFATMMKDVFNSESYKKDIHVPFSYSLTTELEMAGMILQDLF